MSAPPALPQRIVIIAGYARSLIHFRGPLLTAMRAQGHQVIAIAPPHDAMATESAEDIAAQLAELGVHFIPVELARTGLNPREDAASLRALTKLLRELNPDVVFSYTVKPVIYGSLAARLAGVPKIYAMITGLGYAFMPHSGNPKRRLLNRVVRELYRQALKVCNGVIFQNPDDQQQFIELGLVARTKTSVVNGSGLDLAQFVPRPLPAQPVFLLIARLLREKGIEEYVKAAELVKVQRPETRFLILGPLDTSPDALTRADIERWEKSGIKYLGEARDVRPVIEQASIYVLPSYREGTPRTVLEAMAMGRPVITTDAPGCRETVLHGQTGYLVPVGDVPVLAERMLELADQPQQREAFGAAGVELARSKYDVHRINDEMLRIMGLMTENSALNPKVMSLSPSYRAKTESSGYLGKRQVDILISSLALAFLSLPLLIIGLLVRKFLGSPVIFKQIRPGLSNQTFTIYKFRTMTDARDVHGDLLPDGKRLTSFGRFLRSSSLDELPELFNVIKGEMSLVGPRPLLTRYTPYFTTEEAQRFNVRPGITGWAQVNGRNTAAWDDRLAFDVWYVKNMSMLLDFKIIWRTAMRVFAQHGVVVDPESIMQNLDDERRVREIS